MTALTVDELRDAIKDRLVSALIAWDDSRARTTQVALGPSDLLGCRAKAWHRLNGSPKSNPDVIRLPSIYGTAIHLVIAEAFKRLDPWGEVYVVESTVEGDGMSGHVDLRWAEHSVAVDWKSGKLKSARFFPSTEQRSQVQGYAAMTGDDLVALVFLPRDGDERDIKVHVELADPAMAEHAMAWKADVEARTEAPEPEKDAAKWCRFYCQFFGATCPGVTR